MSRSRSSFVRLLAVLFSIMLVAAACGDDDTTTSTGDPGSGTDATAADSSGADEPIKVAFVYVGPIGDAGWTKRHDDGRKALEAHFGDDVETTFIESVEEGAPSEAVFEQLARDGNDIIFGTSFGYMDPMLTVAEKYPDVTFMHATGYKTAANMGTYFGAAEEARFLGGMAAGAMSEADHIGYVAAFPIPEVLRGINAFTLGAQRINPDVEVEVVWTSTWFGPAVEKEAAESLTANGADVLTMHQDTPSTGEAATEAGAFWVGYQDNMEQFAPDAWLTGVVWDWSNIYIDTVQSVIDGTWTNEQYYGNMADGLVTLAPVSDKVPSDIRDQIEAVMDQIIDGGFAVFAGPVRNQDGEVVIADGETPDLGTLLSMDYLVEGVIGSAKG